MPEKKRKLLFGSDRYSMGLKSDNQVTVWISLSVILIICLLNLTGWAFDITFFKSVDAEWIPMKVITTLCMMLSVASLVMMHISVKPFYRKFISRALSSLVLLIGFLTIGCNIFNILKGTEATISNFAIFDLFLSFQNRMAFITALVFILFGCILVLLSINNKSAYNISHILIFPAALISYSVPVSYLFGVESHLSFRYIPAALNTGVVFCFFSLVLILVRPQTWLTKVFTGRDPGSIMARRLLPVLIILPVIIGWLRILGEHKGIYKSEVGVLLVALSYAFCFVFLIWFTARSVNRTDEKRKKIQETLYGTESNLRAILDATQESVYMFDRKGNLVVSNLTGARRLNLPLSEVIGHKFTDFMPEELAISRTEKLNIVFETAKPVRFEDERNGMIFSHNFYPVFENGEVARVVSYSQEITSRKKAENDIIRSRQEWIETFDMIPDLIAIIDTDHRILRANKAMIDKMGVSSGEARGIHCYECVHGTSSAPSFCPHTLTLLDGKQHIAEVHEDRLGGEFLVSNTPIYDTAGKLIGSVHVARDISERKRAEDLLKKALSRLNLVVSSMYGAILLVGNERTELVNQNFCDTFGLRESPEELIGLEPDEMIARIKNSYLHPEKEIKRINEIVKTGQPVMGEEVALIGGRSCLRDFIPLYQDENLYGRLWYHVDITERKKTEDALRVSEAQVRMKLESVLSPEGDIGNLSLADILDTKAIQSLLDKYFQLVNIPVGIIDINGEVLIKVGWQDICTRFHRANSKTCLNCIESDTRLATNIPEGEFKLYRCRNGMQDMATPIMIGDRHMGNLFLGQFFFYDEPIDYDYFRAQALKYGFDEKEYFSALLQVPRISRTDLESAKGFFLNLTHSLAQLSYSNIKLARNISQKEMLEQALKNNNERLDILSLTSSRLLESENPQNVVNELCSRVMKFLDCDVFFNFLVDESQGRLHLNTCSGIPEKTAKQIEWLDFGVAVCGCVARAGERIIAENIPETPDPRTDLIKSFGIKAYACHPLMSSGIVIGTLSFGTRNRIHFSSDDISMMKAITDQVAIAMSRVRNEEKVRQSEIRFRTITESLPVQLAISRIADSTIAFTNEAYSTIFGFKRGELIGRRTPELYYHPEDRDAIMKLLNKQGFVKDYEVNVKKADGSPFWIMASMQPIFYANEPSLLVTSVDITERKRNEAELLQLNRTLNSLNKSSQVMMHALNEKQYLNDVCRIIIEDCGHLLVWIGYKQEDDEKSVLPVAYSGFDEGYIQSLKITWADNDRGRGPTGIALRTGKPAMCINMLTDPAFEPWRREALKRGYASSIVFPLISEGNTFGALSIYSREANPFSEAEITLLTTLSNDLAYGISYIRLIEAEKEALKTIKESEEKYHQLFDGMNEGFAFHELITDEKGKPCDYRFLSINPAFEDQTGLKGRDIIGRKVTEVLPGTEKYWIETYGKVALTGETVEFENYSSDLNKYFRVSSFCPKKGFFAVIFEDITVRVLAEKELQETKKYLENLINYSNAPIIVWNTKNEIQLFNNAFQKFTSYTPEEVIGRKIDLLFPRSSIKESKEKIKNALSENLESIEIPIMTKNNEIKVVLWNSAKIFDSDGNLVSTIAQGNDITERLKAEQAVKIAKDKLEIALENGSIGIWEWDIRKDTFEGDDRMKTMFGMDPGSDEKTYENFEQHIHEDDLSHMRNAFRLTIEQDVPLDTIFRIRAANDETKYISTKALVEKDNNKKPIRLSGVCFDITAMKKGAEKALFQLNEDLLRSNKELEQFAYIASHDLQEPLRMVSSFTQLLSLRYKDKLDTDANDFIQFAVDGAIRMQGLINDLLEYSRIETRGRKFSTIDMHSVLGHTIKNLSLIINEKNALVINGDMPFIIADEGQMVQLLQNLVGNALKFCETSPRIQIEAQEEPEFHIFSVKDNGIGMESQYFNKIFQIFQRLGGKDEYGGTGIGLAICKRIVERHGGKIWVESKPGRGSKFYFSISKNLNNH